MKKIIALFLALCLGMSLAACSAEKEKVMKTDIVGEWIAVNGNAAATFNEDGTGVVEYNGNHNVRWTYNPDTDRYAISGEMEEQVLVSKEYDMDYVSMMDMNFYHLDDYDNAYTLMISRRCEDIVNLTLEMTKIEAFMIYELSDSASFCFTEISRVDGENEDSLQISYCVLNEHADAAFDSLSAVMKGRYYLADFPGAVTTAENITFSESIGAGEMTSGTVEFSLGADSQLTVDSYGMVIGALYFEVNGQSYYIDLGEYFQ